MPILTAALVLLIGNSATDADSKRILDACDKAYKNLKSYSETGVVQRRVFMNGLIVMNDRRKFKTWFSRPTKLKFEFADPPSDFFPENKWYIWSGDKGKYKIWTDWSPQGKVSQVSLFDAFQSWGNFHSTASDVAIKFLMPEVSGGDVVTDLSESKLAGTEYVDGFSCYIVKGEDSIGFDTTLWIDKKTMLIRKFDQRTTNRVDGVINVDSTTIYIKPVPNPKLAAKDFVFTPKISKR